MQTEFRQRGVGVVDVCALYTRLDKDSNTENKPVKAFASSQSRSHKVTAYNLQMTYNPYRHSVIQPVTQVRGGCGGDRFTDVRYERG